MRKPRAHHKLTCRKGHALVGDNRIVFADDRSSDGERWRCRTCTESAPRLAPKRNGATAIKGRQSTRGSWGRQAPFISALTPVMLADCKAALARLDAMEVRDPSIRGGARRRAHAAP